MRCLALLLLAVACAPATEADAPDTDADADSDADADADADTDTDVEVFDTGLALVYTEGSAGLTLTTWEGSEDYVATSLDGAVELCRVTNTTLGVPADLPCPTCTYAFEVTLSAGTTTGDACGTLGFLADMFDEDRWFYAYAPSYFYAAADYTYGPVLLLGVDEGGTIGWAPWALAEVHGDPGGDEGGDIDYEMIFADLAYTYAR
jgi:hypothetical protein